MYYRFRKMLLYFRRMVQYIRRGGVVYANISQIHRGDVLKGKRVLITGGTSGIGFAIAQKFISEGAKVAVTGRNKEKLRKAVELLGENSVGVDWDLSDITVVSEKVKEVVALLNGIDILVNNAGYCSRVSFSKLDSLEWDKTFDVNLKGLYFLSREVVLTEMIPNKGGKMINISSTVSYRGELTPYSISKCGVNAITKSFARSFTQNNIIVNAIAPGVIPSEMSVGYDEDGNIYSQLYQELDQRIGLPEEISELALFLASNASNHIIGHVIPCDGGSSLT